MKKQLIIICILFLVLGITACNTSKVSIPAPVNVEVKKVGVANELDDFAYSRIDTCEHILDFL